MPTRMFSNINITTYATVAPIKYKYVIDCIRCIIGLLSPSIGVKEPLCCSRSFLSFIITHRDTIRIRKQSRIGSLASKTSTAFGMPSKHLRGLVNVGGGLFAPFYRWSIFIYMCGMK